MAKGDGLDSMARRMEAEAGAERFSDALRQKLSWSNIPALGGIRAIAVFLVFFYHFGFERVPASLGVLGFFVLSGFLITWLLLKEADRTGEVSLSGFYLRRTIRIFPAFYVYWFGTMAMLYFTRRPIPWAHALAAFFYMGDYYNAILQPPPSFVSHTWSLAIEEQFYLMWPILFCLFRKDLKKLTGVLVGLIAFVWVYRIVLSAALNVSQSYIYNAFDTRLDHLMVGCLLAVGMKRGLLKSFWQFVCSRIYFPAVTFALIGVSIYLNWTYATPYRDRIGFIVDPLLVAVLMIQLVWFSSSSAWGWIEWPWMRFLGKISYSLYLYQQIVIHPVQRMLADKPVAFQLAASLAGLLAAAAGSYYLVEMPFLKLRGTLEARVSRIPARFGLERA